MFQFKHDFNEYFVGVQDVGFTRELNPELQSLEEGLAVHAQQVSIPTEQQA